MAERHTAKQLRNMLGFINEKLETEHKKLDIDIAYGGYQLVIVHLDQGRSESDLSRRLSATEMYEVLKTIQNLLDVWAYHDWLKLPPKK